MFTALALLLPILPAAGGNKVALEAALSAVSAEEIKTDLYFIASDDLEGRDTPSAGLNTAASYIRSRLHRLGWQPGAKDGYYYVWQVEKKGLDPDLCHVDFGGQSFALGKDYFLSGFGLAAARETSGAVVCLGEAKKEDVEKLELTGKWALVLDRAQDFGPLRRDLAKKQVAGMIVLPAPDYSGKPYAERFASDFAMQKTGRVSRVRAEDEAKSAEPERPRGIVSVYLAPEAGKALLAAAGVKADALASGMQLKVEVKETRGLAGKGGRIDVQNVCGFWPGSDPTLKNEMIIISAHYDHVGMEGGVVHNGADDNGSGTCCLLSLAEAIKQYGPLRRSIFLMWVCGEEKGLWGSEAWNKNPYLPEGCKPVADINIDMVGRNAPEKLLITPTEKHKSYSFLTKVAESFAAEEGFHGPNKGDPPLGSADAYWTRSDHYNFVQAGIPACFLFSDVHEDYHQPTDDPEKIDYDKIHRAARLVLRMLDALQNDKIDG